MTDKCPISVPVITFSIRAKATVRSEFDTADIIAEFAGVAVLEVADAVTMRATGRVGRHVGMIPSRAAVAAVDMLQYAAAVNNN